MRVFLRLHFADFFLWKAMLILLVLAGCLSQQALAARELSKAGQVFETVKPAVVTIFSSAGHGSGFLVDVLQTQDATGNTFVDGLVMTNAHVVRNARHDLRVRFGPNQVVAAQVLQIDRNNDTAILWVNLKKLPAIQPLSLFPVAENSQQCSEMAEPLVMVGEQVLAIGTPFDRNAYDKVMSQGVVSKFDQNTILHDANINPGNSGGPLINFDGQVVGLNTFHVGEQGGAGLSGTIAITRALPTLQAAKQKLAQIINPSVRLTEPSTSSSPGSSSAAAVATTTEAKILSTKASPSSRPSRVPRASRTPRNQTMPVAEAPLTRPDAQLLPDASTLVDYPVGDLLRQTPELFNKHLLRDYIFSSAYYTFAIQTPPLAYKYQVSEEQFWLSRRQARAKQKGFKVDDDEFESRNIAYYKADKPLVRVWIYPLPKNTRSTNTRNTIKTLTFLGAVGLAFAAPDWGFVPPMDAVPQVKEIKKDFETFRIASVDGKRACEAYATGRLPSDPRYVELFALPPDLLQDKTFVGVYEFSPECFNGSDPLAFDVISEGEKAPLRTILPAVTRQAIIDDFKPYYAHLARQNVPQSQQPKPSTP